MTTLARPAAYLLAALLAAFPAQANPIHLVVDDHTPVLGATTLSGKQSVSIFSGNASGSVSGINISFFFSPVEEIAQEFSSPSDFSLIIVPPSGDAQQWGGFDWTYPGATKVANWNPLHIPTGAGAAFNDQTYGDTVSAGLGALTGTGIWQILIMNGWTDSPHVFYGDVHVELTGITSVPEGFAGWEMVLMLAGVTGVLGFVRTKMGVA